MSPERDCVLECGPDKTCYADTCCARSGYAEPPAGTEASRQETQPNLRQRAKCPSSTPPEQAAVADGELPTTFTENLGSTACCSFPVAETSDTRA